MSADYLVGDSIIDNRLMVCRMAQDTENAIDATNEIQFWDISDEQDVPKLVTVVNLMDFMEAMNKMLGDDFL